MNNYYDRWGRLHHKPCINGEPSSNNGWIYTAYDDKLAPLFSDRYEIVQVCFELCGAYTGALTRHPKSVDSNIPISRDEILGMASLGFLKPTHLDGWNFSPFHLPRLNLFKLISQLWDLRPEIAVDVAYIPHPVPSFELNFKHRNYFWQNNLDQLYRFAFSVPLQDRAFILRCWGETNTVRYAFYKGIELIDKALGKQSGIGWLKYGGDKAAMLEEFPEDHPLRSR